MYFSEENFFRHPAEGAVLPGKSNRQIEEELL